MFYTWAWAVRVGPGLSSQITLHLDELTMPDSACDFGCGRIAIKQLKNGRFLCAEFVAQCPTMRAKNNPYQDCARRMGERARTRTSSARQAVGRRKAAGPRRL